MRVVPAFDELEHRDARLDLRAEAVAIKKLALERGEEALAHRVVVCVADRSHRWPHAGLPAAFAEGDRGVLTALIGVMDHLARPPLEQRHVEGLEDELGPQMGLHRPADDSAAPRVQHDREIEEARPRRDVGDVSDPETIRSRDDEVAGNQVRRGSRVTIAHCRERPLSPRHALQATPSHETSDSLSAHKRPSSAELSVHPRSAVGPLGPMMNLADLRLDCTVGLLALRHRTLRSCPIPAGGDAQRAAHRGGSVHGLVPLRRPVFMSRKW